MTELWADSGRWMRALEARSVRFSSLRKLVYVFQTVRTCIEVAVGLAEVRRQLHVSEEHAI